MKAADMLIEAHAASAVSATTNPGEETAGTCCTDDLSPTVETMTPEELDVGGSEFSWSTVASETAMHTSDTPAATSESILEVEVTVADKALSLNQPTSSMGTRTDHDSVPSTQRHSVYFWDSITFKVEDIEFQLPKYRFVEESEAFMRMVAGDEAEGPIELNVSLGDFESFLKVFLPRASAMYDERPVLTKDEWISVLKLSTKWLFNNLRKLAICHLSSTEMGAIDCICLAKEYRVSKWLMEGYEQIIRRLLTIDDIAGSPTTLNSQEGKRIGLEVALELSGITIRRVRRAERKVKLSYIRMDVLDAFKEEFDCIQEDEAQFKTRPECLEEAIKKAKQKELEETAAQCALEEEVEKVRVLKEAERKKEAEMGPKCQGEEANNEVQAEGVEGPKSTEGLSPVLKKTAKKKENKLRKEAKKREVKEDETRRMVAEIAKQLEEEEAQGFQVGRLEEEDIEELQKRIAKRWQEDQESKWQERQRKRAEGAELKRQEQQRNWDKEDRKSKDAEDKKLRALLEEELMRRKGLAEEKANAENTSG